ncbi:MAG: acylphosphatase [Proteobacteria bacterium]|nr:acylphosphatase [Pseudomonadota bacterium]
MRELHAIIHGKVQGVFFRAWTRDTAQALGLCGWVRNLPDGSVETVAQGEETTLKRFERSLHQGPPLSRVIEVQSTLRDPVETGLRFEIRR